MPPRLNGAPPASQVLHRDVKPANILLDERGTARLADVGLAKVADAAAANATHMSTRNVAGTPAFLDPLYLSTLQQSELTDGFAAGITLLMALVGQPALGLYSQCRHSRCRHLYSQCRPLYSQYRPLYSTQPILSRRSVSTQSILSQYSVKTQSKLSQHSASTQ